MKPRKRIDLWIALGELFIISLWALWVGRAYLDFDPTVWPAGRELGMVIRTHYIWTLLPRCGDCVLWNGFINGGAPAFAELQGAVLHPLVVLATLIWGGINGVKVVLLASLMMAGWAQWWLSRVMGLGRLARLWAAALAIVGGHLAGRMEHGVAGLVLSTAACSLVIPPALDWVKTGRRRSAVLLGVTLAGALLSGQVYMQLALFLGVFPAFAVYVLDPQLPRRRLLKGFAFAAVLAFLLSGVFWAPLLHFLPNFSKDLDPAFTSVQPLEYLPLNLVIRDLGFYYNSRTLGRWPYPYLYVTYIGWIPALLALIPLRLASHDKRRQLRTLLLAIALVYLCASAVILRPLGVFFPNYVNGIRHITVSSGLAVPLVLALAAWGLDLALQWTKARWRWPTSILAVLVSMALLQAVRLAYDFSQTWLYTVKTSPDVYALMDTLRTESAQWVSPPFGEHFWTPPALEARLKLTHVVGPWRWKNRDYPAPYLEAIRESQDGWVDGAQGRETEFSVEEDGEQVYASVKTSAGITVCYATALGGHIDVACETDAPGVLTVKENNWTGWYAWQDGARTRIAGGEAWLTVDAPAGASYFTFRYRPWDVPLGILVTCVGIALCILLWLRPLGALPALAALNLWVDRGIAAFRRLVVRASTKLCASDFGEQRTLRRSAWIVNGLASVTLLTILGLRLWFNVSPSVFIMRFLVALFIAAAFAGIVILSQYTTQRKKQAQHPPESADDDE